MPRALIGFIVEDYPQPDDVDAFGVPMHRFRVAGSEEHPCQIVR